MTAVSGYQVGRGKPPKETQFKKGQSGNPKGKPKRKPSVTTMFAEQLKAKVTIKEHGKRRSVMMLELIIKQAITHAAAGNFKPMILFERLRPMLHELTKLPIGKEAKKSLTKEDLAKMSLSELQAAFKQAIADTPPPDEN